jgi:hypothetical protein
MKKPRFVPVLVCLIGAGLAPSPAVAQIYETVGTRAQGMGGAFTAVSDDATATWWNPAGIALSYFSLVVDYGQTDEPADPGPVGPAWRGKIGTVAAAFPALGLSYYRVRIHEIVPQLSGANGELGRQEPGAGGSLRAFMTHQFGATFGQSIGDHLVVASTLRWVRAGQAFTLGTGIDDAEELDVELEDSADIDLGVMAIFGPARVGASVKHLREPEFGEGLERFILKRQARAGFAWVMGEPGALSRLTLAADADLLSSTTALGEVRHWAGGAEFALPRAHLAVRGGFSANTIGDLTTSTSLGGSLGLSRGFYVDGAWTFGSDRSRGGWSVGFRMTI